MGRSTLNRVLRAAFRSIGEADILAGGGKTACRDFFNNTGRLLPFAGAPGISRPLLCDRMVRSQWQIVARSGNPHRIVFYV
jgi:hypothetical protein